ncbi:MAG: hypothetical protein IJ207_05700 [Treponema sp.]|uniref:hypothetical protein n=1 Tax=Treponema sp. TaxID=166 RepID=UPI0025F0406E|nr:hypothetical protein [Treponema sp.]MBQ9281676.1 hypothetical protein [Treponema sp.]
MFKIIDEKKIDKREFNTILGGWEYFFNKNDFFTNAVFDGTEMDEIRICKSEYGVLKFRNNYLELINSSENHLVFSFGKPKDNLAEQIFVLYISFNEKEFCIKMKNTPETLPVLPNEVFQELGRPQFFDGYMRFLQSLEIAEKKFKMNLDEREWE